MNDFLQNLRNGQAEKQRPQKTRKSYDNSHQYTNSRFRSYGVYQSNRSQPHMKRSSAPSQEGNQPQGDDNLVTSMLAEAIENLSNHVETLTTNQDFLVKAQEKTAIMLERQVNAVERLLNHFNVAPFKVKEEKTRKNIPSNRVFKNNYVTSKQSKSDRPSPAPPVKKAVRDIKPAKPVISKREKVVKKKIAKTASADSNNKLLGRDAVMNIIQTMRTEGATYDQVAARLIELGQPTFSGRGEWHAQTIHRICSN